MKDVVVIDARKKTDEEVEQIAINELLDGKSIKHEGVRGNFLAGSSIKYYNVKSVCNRIIVASIRELTPQEARLYAIQYLNEQGD